MFLFYLKTPVERREDPMFFEIFEISKKDEAIPKLEGRTEAKKNIVH